MLESLSNSEGPNNGPVNPPVGTDTDPPKKPLLSERQLWFVTLIAQHYAVEGSVLTEDAALNLFGVERKVYKKYMANANVIKALEERGVVFRDLFEEGDFRRKTLTPQQLVVANAMLDLIDTRSYKKKLQDLGVSTSTYNTWLADPAFKKYLTDRAESLIGATQHEAHLALLYKVQQGDVGAIKYFNELNGRFIQAADKNNGALGKQEIQSLLTRVLEIILDEVDDPQTAFRIAERFKNLATAQQVASELSGEALPEPEVAPARELSPAIQKILASGAGVNG